MIVYSSGPRQKMNNVDEFDRQLIRALQDHPRNSFASTARLFGVSETTIKRRVDALIESGFLIPAMIADLRELGYMTSAFVGVTVDLVQLDSIAKQLAEFPETIFVAVTMGRYDLIIFVAEPALEDLTQLVSTKIAAIPGVKSTETLVTPRTYKGIQNWRLPIEERVIHHGETT